MIAYQGIRTGKQGARTLPVKGSPLCCVTSLVATRPWRPPDSLRGPFSEVNPTLGVQSFGPAER